MTSYFVMFLNRKPIHQFHYTIINEIKIWIRIRPYYLVFKVTFRLLLTITIVQSIFFLKLLLNFLYHYIVSFDAKEKLNFFLFIQP